jgi:hypothetical protein
LGKRKLGKENDMKNCLYAKQNGQLQIPYSEYVTLMEKVRDGQRIRQTRAAVIADLQSFLGGERKAATVPVKPKPAKKEAAPRQAAPVAEKVSIEFEAEKPKAPEPKAKPAEVKSRPMAEGIDIPPIKKDIGVHFNKLDDSGRLFNVLKQYYTCLNDKCGGTVRVTMKDGFCSLWNYDEWEEFAFVDMFEGHLRIALDPRYTDELKGLNFCEVPRLLSSRRNLIAVMVDDLNNTMLDILAQAFKEVGLTTR